MRIDAHGNELRQRTVWLPVAILDLVDADGLRLSPFFRHQLELFYGLESENGRREQRDRLLIAAQAAFEKQRQEEADTEAAKERARAAVRVMRDDRDAGRLRQEEITDALVQIIGDDPTGRYLRTLPENDPNGDRADDWDALVRRVSRLCGAEIDTAEVAAGLRTLIAAKV